MQEELQKLKEEFDQRIKELEGKYKSEEEWPKVRDDYWTIDSFGEVVRFSWLDDPVDNIVLNNNAIFKTKEEAQFEAERLKVLRELEKMGRPFEPGKYNYLIHFDHFKRELKASGYGQCQDAYGDFYFNTAVEARQAIEEIGEERIKKYLFGVQ